MILKFKTSHKLNTDDQIIIKQMATRICNQGREYFINNYQRDKSMKLYTMNMNGFGAELAFCRLCKIDFDASTKENENHYLNPDGILKDGRTVDVKNTVYPNGKLLVRCGKELMRVDMYVLMTGTFPVFTFSGFAYYDEIINDDNITNLGYGESYCLNQNQLHKDL